MKIALLNRFYPPYGVTASTTHFYAALAKAFKARGHDVHIISEGIRREDFTDVYGIHIHRVPIWPKGRSVPFLTHFMFLFNSWRVSKLLVCRHKIQLVDAYVFTAHGFFPSLFKQVPLILQVHAWSDMFLKSRNYRGLLGFLTLKFMAYLEEISLRRVDRIIVTSGQTYQHFTQKKPLKDRVSLVWDSRIDPDKFRPVSTNVKEKLDILGGTIVVLYVGTLDARKGLHILIKAIPNVVASFPDVIFLLLGRDTPTAPGGGSFKHYILDCATKSGISNKIMFIEEFVSDEDLVKFYSACDIYILPSLWEGSGMTVVEAMACGRPVVATDTGIAADLKGVSSTLIVVPPNSPHALAQAIIELLSIPKEEREHLCANNCQIVRQVFSFERMIDQILSLYEKVLKKGRYRLSSTPLTKVLESREERHENESTVHLLK